MAPVSTSAQIGEPCGRPGCQKDKADTFQDRGQQKAGGTNPLISSWCQFPGGKAKLGRTEIQTGGGGLAAGGRFTTGCL